MIALLLIACMSNDGLNTALDDIDAAADAMDTLVAEHGTTVAAATTLDDVATAETAFSADWTTSATDLRDALDMIDRCAMDDDDRMSHDDAMSSMDGIDAAGSAHATAMADCATVEDCLTVEAAFPGEISTYTDQIRGCRSGWEDGSVECSMKDMGGMGDNSDDGSGM